MKLKFNPFLRPAIVTAAFALCATAASADTVYTSVDLRILNNGTVDTGALSLYNDGGNVQRSFLQFDLSSYSGKSITSDATLTLVAGIYGNSLTGVSIGTANSSWTAGTINWSTQPGLTAIPGATNPSGSFGSPDGSGPVTWTIPWYMLEKMATAGSGYNNGIGITAGIGSTQHFYSSTAAGTDNDPRLTFTAATAVGSTWSGGNGNWTDTANWAGGTVAEGIGQAATISGGTAVNIAMDANRSVGSLSFSGADHTISNGAGKLALNVVSGSPTVSVEATRTATISAELVGLDGLTKTDTGKLVISGANSYTGTTTINAGTLEIGNGGATGSLYSPSVSSGNLTFGSSGAIVNNGALVYNIAGGSVNVNKTISGTGTMKVTGDQSVNFADGTSISTTGSQTYSATATGNRYYGFNLADNATVTLTSTAGNISMTGMLGTANGNTGNLVINTSAGNGSVTLNTPAGVPGIDYGLNALTVNAGTGAITLGTHNAQNWNHVTTISLNGGAIDSTANLAEFTTLTVNNTSAGTFSGNLTASGAALVKEGTGTLTLSGANTYTGTTTVSAGEISLAGTGSLPTAGQVSIAASGILSNDAATGTSFNLGALTLNGGELAATSTPDFSLGNFHLSGDVTVSGTATSTISADVRVISGQTRDFNVGSTGDASGVDLLISGKLGHQNNVAWGYATKSGAGTMKLSGINQIGGMTINAGRLILEDTAADWGHESGGLTNNAELEYSVTSGLRGNSTSHGGSGNLVKTGVGTQTLSGALGYSGTTTVADGTLNLQGGGGGGSDYNSGNININGASTLRVSGQRYNFGGETFTFDSTGGGTIDAIASGAGGMVFTGNNTFATSGGAQNIISGTRSANEGFNLNGQTATFNVATGTDATSDLKVTGTIWNGGNVVKDGAGTMEFSSNQEYSGTTTVTGGTLIVNGNISTSSMTTVQTGATVRGSGTVGSLTVNSGAFLDPGNSPGILTVDGDYTQAGTLNIEITGLTAGDGGYDQINVDRVSGDGLVTLSGSLVTAFSGGSYVNGSLLFILLNDGSDAISGNFTGFAQNAFVTNYGGFDWKISYTADATGNTFTGGNDVALMAIPEPNVAALLGGLGMIALLRRRRA